VPEVLDFLGRVDPHARLELLVARLTVTSLAEPSPMPVIESSSSP
jgi:hypothetical protein